MNALVKQVQTNHNKTWLLPIVSGERAVRQRGFCQRKDSFTRKRITMKLKASVDYGVRTIMYLAVKGDICSSREISEEMNIPRDYLIQLALRLRNENLIKARPGKSGGYVLAKDPSKITVRQIMDAFDNDLKHTRQPIKAKRKATAEFEAVRKMHNLVSESLNAYLASITVADLLNAVSNDVGFDAIIADSLEHEAARLRK